MNALRVFFSASRLRSALLSAGVVGLVACSSNSDSIPTEPAPVKKTARAALPAPPIAKRVDYAVVSPFGSRNDPYYWLRDDTRKDPEMLAYLNAENAYTQAYFEPLQDQVDSLFEQMKARLKQDDSSVPVLEHGYWYYTRFVEGQQYPIHARRKGDMAAEEQIMLDGNALAAQKDTGYFRIGAAEVSPDGKKLAYAIDRVGRRQYDIRVQDLETGVDLPFAVDTVTNNIVWAADSTTLFYTDDNDETLLPYRLYRKSIVGKAAAELVYEEADNTFYLGIGASKSERFVVVFLSSTLTSEVRLIPSDKPAQVPQIFLARERGHDYSLDHRDGEFIIRSNRAGADNFALYRASEQLPSKPENWTTLLAHRSDALVEDFELYRNHIGVNERSGGLLKIRVLPLAKGASGESAALSESTVIAADDPSFAMSIESTPDAKSELLRYSYDSLTTPSSVFELNLASGERKLLKQDPVLGEFDASAYQSEYLHATARDGSLIPISVVYKKSTPRDGSAPLYQYAYGSYGSSTDPYFSTARLSLLDNGFVFAIAHIRGGEEMGRSWYENGKLLKKINTFTDFIDVTDFLVKKKYGAKDKIVAAGGSAGGLLMGAVINMAPEKYRAVAAHVPFVDVVTTMLDESIPLTTGEFDEWGNPKEKAYYDYMLSYSPYDQVRAQDYPTLLVTTGLHDSQVQYFEPAKWVAKLRTLKTDKNPLVFKINMEAGHGGRSGRFDRLKEVAQEYAFFMDAVK